MASFSNIRQIFVLKGVLKKAKKSSYATLKVLNWV